MPGWELHMQKAPRAQPWIPIRGLNEHTLPSLLEKRPRWPPAHTQMRYHSDGSTFSFLSPLITRQKFAVTPISHRNHHAPLGSHRTFAFPSLLFGFYCLIVTKNSFDRMKVTYICNLFFSLYLYLQLDTIFMLCELHIASFMLLIVLVPMLPAGGCCWWGWWFMINWLKLLLIKA